MKVEGLREGCFIVRVTVGEVREARVWSRVAGVTGMGGWVEGEVRMW